MPRLEPLHPHFHPTSHILDANTHIARVFTHLVDDVEAEGDGLLAEDHLSGLRRGHDLVRVLVGGGADDDSLHLGVVDELRRMREASKHSHTDATIADGVGREEGG